MQTIVGHLDAARELAVDRVIVQFMAGVGQVRSLGPKLGDDIEGLVEPKVGGVRLVAQGVEDQHPHPFEAGHARPWDVADVGAIRHIVDTEAEDVEVGMFEGNGHDRLADDAKRIAGDAMKGQLGNEPRAEFLGRGAEGVRKRALILPSTSPTQ